MDYGSRILYQTLTCFDLIEVETQNRKSSLINSRIVPQLFSSSKGSRWKDTYFQELCWWLHDSDIGLVEGWWTFWDYRTFCSIQIFLHSRWSSSSELITERTSTHLESPERSSPFCGVSGVLKETRTWTSVLSWFYNQFVLLLLFCFCSTQFSSNSVQFNATPACEQW